MPFDPEVFGGGGGFDADVFSTPKAKESRQTIANRINNDAISQDARAFPGQGSDALGGASQFALNLLGGGLRGAGSFGATAMRVLPSALGGDTAAENARRRSDMDAALTQFGANPNSLTYQGGKLGTEILGTAGVGGALANGLRAALPAVRSLPVLNALSGVARGLETGGFNVGPLAGTLPGTLARIGTGAAGAGTAAFMVDPKDAATGALIGGVLPGVTQLAGKVGDVAGSVFQRAPKPSERMLDTARQSIDAGYVIPPNMVKPGFTNQVIESISGKQATQQIASVKNNAVTEGLVKQALGLPDDAQLTQSTMEQLRKTAGKAYADVANLSPQAASDLEALKQARNDAAAWFKSYNRTASPTDLATAKQLRATANNLENLLEFQALQAGRGDLVPALQDARKQIAKTYTVGRALNDAAGTVDARVLGRMYEKGLPLSDGLDVAGQFASAFPTIAKTPQQIGSPAAHNLKSIASMALGSGGYAAGGLPGIALGAVPFVAPPIARSIMFSGPAQRALLAAPREVGPAMGLLSQNAYRVSPLLGGPSQ